MSSSETIDVSAALKIAGLQVTAQRLAVHKAVSENPHTMADEICDIVRSEIGAISRQAVYDTLNVMSEHGLIRRIQPAGLAARYEDRLNAASLPVGQLLDDGRHPPEGNLHTVVRDNCGAHFHDHAPRGADLQPGLLRRAVVDTESL